MTPNPNLTGMFAYPSKPFELAQTIVFALQRLSDQSRTRGLSSWEELDIPGRFIQTEIMRRIRDGNAFFADITRLNFNVVFEIGFAIGCGKRAILVRNKSIKGHSDLIREVGIFDTLGYQTYSDSSSLEAIVNDVADLAPLQFEQFPTNSSAPVYLVLPPTKGDIETHLTARIKKARLFYRSFDPQEQGRLSAMDAIENVSISHGVIIPLLPEDFVDSRVHNLRAAFVAGLAAGMDRPSLLLQSGDDPIPLDYIELVKHFKFPDQMDDFVADFATNVYASIQSVRPPVTTKPDNLLQRLMLGASSAENEYRELGDYYLVTDEFRSVESGEVQVVLGRKGSGKSALFFQLRDRLRQHKQTVVVDLKPEGFQLVKFKQQVLDFLEEGTREHTITAFWEYLLLLEICYKVLEDDKLLYLRNHQLFQPYQRLAAMYASDKFIAEGDFAERMLRLTQRIADDFSDKRGDDTRKQRLSSGEITLLLHRHDVGELLVQLVGYLQQKDSLWILFDNLDKGWPAHGISSEDVLSLRCLLDAISKIQRSFRKKQIPTTGVIFIRNDVYENLVESLPDRGKISHILIDWSDPALLLDILRRRFLRSGLDGDPTFAEIWEQICVSHVGGQYSADYLIDRCLMRPRSLIEFLKFCRSHAVNLGHKKIEADDICQGEEKYSTQMVNDISYEIRDVFPTAANALYEFIECRSEMNEEQLKEVLTRISPGSDTQEKILDLLLWYGVIGFRRAPGDFAFIYSVGYDIRRLRTLLQNRAVDGVTYIINPAFWAGLEVKH
jgi:hypothetical protein